MSGRITTTQGVVLSRREHRETDRIALIYTEEYGKLPARFVGSNRPRAKLRALSEPMTWGEYRLHVRPGAEYATVLGGALVTSFPSVRADLETTLRGLEACELLERMTPVWQPNPVKFELLTECLSILESKGSRPWVCIGYALRLLRVAGFDSSKLKVSEANRKLWLLLHEADLAALAALPGDPEREGRLENFIAQTVANATERPLRAPKLRHDLIAHSEPASAGA